MPTLAERLAAGLSHIDEERRKREEEQGITDTDTRRWLAGVNLPESETVSAVTGSLGDRLAAGLRRARVADFGLEVSPAGPAYRKVKAGLGKVVDIFSRGQYMMATTADEMAKRYDAAEDAGLGHSPIRQLTDGLAALKAGLVEGAIGGKPMSFIDVLKRHAPEFTNNNPKTAWTLGLVGDVLIDPLNLIGFGEAKSAIRVPSAAGKMLRVDRAAAKATMRELLEKTGEGLAPTLRQRLYNAVFKMPKAEQASADHLRDVVKSLHEGAITRYADEKKKLLEVVERTTAGEVPQLPGGVPASKLRNAPEGQLPLPYNLNPLDVREEAMRRLADLDASHASEMEDLARLHGRIENQVASRRAEKMDTLRAFLDSRPTTDAIHDFVSDTAEKRFAELLDDPEFFAKVRDLGGVKVAGKSVVPGEVFDALGKRLGVPELKARLKKLADEPLPLRETKWGAVGAGVVKLGDKIAQGFSRNWRLPEEYIALRKEFEARMIAAHQRARRNAMALFDNVSNEGRKKVNDLAQELNSIRHHGIKSNLSEVDIDKNIAAAVKAADLTPDEFRAFALMRQDFQTFRSIEQELGLLESLHADYYPMLYRLTRSSGDWFRMKGMRKNKLGGFFAPNERRMFADEAAARAAGFSPETDALTVYLYRATAHDRAVSTELFRKRIEEMFPGLTRKPSAVDDIMLNPVKHSKRLKRGEGNDVIGVVDVQDPEMARIARDITYVGEGAYNRNVSAMTPVLRAYDRILGFTKSAATVLRPAFSIKQMVSNQMQSYLVLGRHAFTPSSYGLAASAIRSMRAFDPRTTVDAMLLLTGEKGSFSIRTALGQRLSGAQIAKELEDFGVVRGITLDGVGAKELGSSRWIKSIQDDVKREMQFRNLGKGFAGSAQEGFARAISGLARYTDFPARVEDFSRVTLYVNARRLGHSPAAAARLVDDALFDYMNGLSQFEARWLRRAVPFYSYRRFAIPMIGKVLAKNPGHVANVAKVTDRFFEVYGKFMRGEELTDDERHTALPGYILDQPHSIAQFNGLFQAVVHTFNGFTPIDVLAEFMPGEDDVGEKGTRRWFEKAFMAQLAPLFKVPLERNAGKEYFSGRALDSIYDRQLGEIDPDLFLSVLAAEVTMNSTGNLVLSTIAGTAANAGTKMAPEAAKKILKAMLGWEEGVDPRTGKPTVLVNAYQWQLAQSLFPAMQDARKLGDVQEAPLTRARRFLFGVNETEVDMKESAQRGLQRRKWQIAEQKRLVRQRALEQRLDARDAAMEDLRELVQVTREESDEYQRNFQ